MAKFVTIGERLSVTAPTVNKAFAARDEEPILKRAKQQLDAGAVYLSFRRHLRWRQGLLRSKDRNCGGGRSAGLQYVHPRQSVPRW